MDGADVRELPQRIEALLDQLSSDPAVASTAEQLVVAVVQLYGAGLERIVALVDDPSRLVVDDLVGNLLLLHGLHPVDVDSRIQSALDRVRPYLGSHAGGVEYLGIDDSGVAHLRLEGSCDGCAGSAATVHTAVERAVLDAAPEVVSVAVEGVAEPTLLLQIGMRCPDDLAGALRS